MERNAIILAAGKSSRFAPFTYERPKGLFRVRGEILIERQIEQLVESGIKDIYVVVGYMKEKFFYLEQKYPEVKLIVNNRFGVKGNLYSLYVAREYLHNTYVCCADHYFVNNPFLDDNPKNISYRACSFKEGRFGEFSCDYSDADVITGVNLGGCYQMALAGQAYFNDTFSARFKELLEKEINDFRVSSLFWEEFYQHHIKELTLYIQKYNEGDVLEFNNIEDLRQFDSDFLYNVDSEIISNICNTLHCHPNNINDIHVINAGLTNVSFRFMANGVQYVYRHPGGTAGNLINRQAELFTQMSARELGVDKSVITMDLSGWKLSYCVQDLVECDFRKYPEQLKKGMEYLRQMHALNPKDDIKTFDDFEEGLKLMKIASSTKGNLLVEFAEEIEKAKKLSEYLKADAERMGIKKVLCHNDTYEPNYLATKDGDLYLIDWEYAGLNDPANDLACFFCRYDYTDEQIDMFMKEYFQRELTEDEHRHWIAYIAMCGFYWFGWGLYKGSVGDDDGFFFLPAYRNFQRFIDKALQSYTE
ncbi:NTP transferase domain-containing protein [Segatella bryantii]|uniref:NTP transferase domain-containing protein n=1 Tax=Segatella bryantii TaxID=77095 RepID=UPI00241F510A|nr:NTP transferase domain-containing protein [Segatella bryantii]